MRQAGNWVSGQENSASESRVDVILPAGGKITGEFARIAGQEIKALISLQNVTLLRRAIEVLRETGRIDRIVVVGPDATRAEAESAGADAALPEGDSGPANFFRGLDWLEQNSASSAVSINDGKKEHRVLIVATDLPFLTADSIIRFLDACPPDADISVPVMSQAAMEARFPALPGAYVPLIEGPITTGCAFLIRPEALRRNRARIEAIFAARKNQLAMARLLGFGFILRYVLRRLSVRDIETQCCRILDCSGAAILDAAPELAFDMDTPEEYEYAKSHAAEIENEIKNREKNQAVENKEKSEVADYARN